MKTVKIEVEQIKASLLRQGQNENKAAEKALELYKEITAYVPENFQAEVDFYLKNQTTSDTELGKRLASLMRLQFGSFFDALTTLATAIQ